MKVLLLMLAHLLTTLAKLLGPGGAKAIVANNLRKTFATRLLSRSAAITDDQHLLGHASVKTTEKAYAAFVKNESFKQTIDLLDKPVVPKLKVVG
jgi:integrase